MTQNNNNVRLVDKLFKTDRDSAALYVLVGKSNKGKSHLTRYILINRLASRQWHFGLVFCKSKFNNDYTSFLPDNRIIEGYNEDMLIKYVDNLKKIVKEKGSVPASFLIFDDLIGVLNNASDWFSNFIATFRHVNINVFICVQYLTGRKAISPIMREQTNFAIMFQSRTRRTLENLYESYGGLFDTVDDFKQHFFNATKVKYSAMLYSEDIDDVDENYITIQAPAEVPKIKFKF